MNPPSLWFLYAGAILILVSLLSFTREHQSQALWFLFLGGTCLFIFAGLLDPFLNLWDERFHALVAKNLVNHPLKPTLYDDPVVPMAYDRWDRFHIWLHKQPWFLWQIALSFKLFGVSEFSLRLPSVLMSSGMVWLVYRIGKILVNGKVGYLASFLFVTSFFYSELVSGRQELDHNDLSFVFYIAASIWSFCEYSRTGKWYWAVLTGILSGLAILCKWLAGLLVYLFWGTWGLAGGFREHHSFGNSILHLLMAFLITVIVMLPWQILIFSWYPTEAHISYAYFTGHIFTALDGHSGGLLYYIDHFKDLYGTPAAWLILPALTVFLLRVPDRRMRWAVGVSVVFVYLFFTAARTKMIAFPFIVAPFIWISLAAVLEWGVARIAAFKMPAYILRPALIILLVYLGFQNFDYRRVRQMHAVNDPDNRYSEILEANKAFFLSLPSQLPPGTVIFNVKGRHYVECMFYTGLSAYNFFPSPEQCRYLREKGRHMAMVDDPDRPVPEWLREDPSIIMVRGRVSGWD